MKRNLFLLLIAAAACGPVPKDRPLVVATTGMLADACRELLPDTVQVTGLMGPGVDPHLYKARQQDIAAFRQADLIVYNGLHLEGKLTEVLSGMKERTYAAAERLDPALLKAPADGSSAHDPHVWQDPVLWRVVVDSLAMTLQRQFPALSEEIGNRHAAYGARLDSLHAWAESEMNRIPAERRLMITAHDAFSYFGTRYGIEIHALQGISTVAEFGLKDLTDLVQLVTDRKVPAIFVESSISSRSIESVQAGCREKGHTVRIGGTLYSDALGNAGSPAGTYTGMIRHNVATLVEGLK